MKHLQRLPKRILQACARYWNNKTAQIQLYDENFKELIEPVLGIQWDKTADLFNVEAIAQKTGLSWEACVGTFWFRKGRVVIEVSEHQRTGIRRLEPVRK